MPYSNHSSNNSYIKIIILFALLAIISICIGSYNWWMANQIKQIKEEPNLTISQPIFMDLEPFTVNLPNLHEYPDQVLYIDITLRLVNEESRKKLLDFLPEVRSRILLLLSEQNSKVISTHEGKLQLMQSIKTILSPTMVPGEPDQDISDVLFTTFILR